MFVCSSVSLSIRLSVRLSVHPSVCSSVRLSIRLSVRQSICPSVCPSVSPFVRPSVRPSVRPFIGRSVWTSTPLIFGSTLFFIVFFYVFPLVGSISEQKILFWLTQSSDNPPPCILRVKNVLMQNSFSGDLLAFNYTPPPSLCSIEFSVALIFFASVKPLSSN